MVYIKGIQMDALDTSNIEVIARGQCYEKNNKLFVTYIDKALNQDQQTKTTLKISNHSMSIIRFGGANTHMMFEKEKRHNTQYETPLGTFEISTVTKKFEIKQSEEEVILTIGYSLVVDYVAMGENTIHIKIKSDDTPIVSKI